MLQSFLYCTFGKKESEEIKKIVCNDESNTTSHRTTGPFLESKQRDLDTGTRFKNLVESCPNAAVLCCVHHITKNPRVKIFLIFKKSLSQKFTLYSAQQDLVLWYDPLFTSLTWDGVSGTIQPSRGFPNWSHSGEHGTGGWVQSFIRVIRLAPVFTDVSIIDTQHLQRAHQQHLVCAPLLFSTSLCCYFGV